MQVRDLWAELVRCRKEYGPDFMDWEVYTEQCTEGDKKFKRKPGKKGWKAWETINDEDGWEYFRCHGFWTKWSKKKIFTVNVNF